MDTPLVENEYTELKKSTAELPRALQSMSAILNRHQSGKIYFGVNDDGTVIGQQISEKTIRDVANAIATKIRPHLRPEIESVIIDNKPILVVSFAGRNVPYSADGRYFWRIGDADQKLEPDELDRLFNQYSSQRLPWEKRSSGVSIDDIDTETLETFVARGYQKNRLSEPFVDKHRVLERLGLMGDQGQITNAGYWLFGINPNVHLKVAIFATPEKSTFIDMQNFSGNIFQLIERGENYFKQNIRWYSNFNTGRLDRDDIPEIPLLAFREALLNSFIHRDWDNQFDNSLAIYSDRVELNNPGSFYPSFSPEVYFREGAPSRPRNPLIANTVYKSGMIETWGTGIKKIHDLCLEAGVSVDFIDRQFDFTVKITRKTAEQLARDAQENPHIHKRISIGELSGRERAVVAELIKNSELTIEQIAANTTFNARTVAGIIKQLREEGIVERLGANRNGRWQVNLSH